MANQALAAPAVHLIRRHATLYDLLAGLISRRESHRTALATKFYG